VRGRSFVFIAWLVLVAGGCADGPVPGRPVAEYDADSGRLRRLEFDALRNGRNNAVGIMDGTRIERIELDLDEDGLVDRWDFYRDGRRLDRVGFSQLKDGIMDAQAFYDAAGGVDRIEISTRRDGEFDRVEFYEDGRLVRGEIDRDGDGRVDAWETYRANPGARAGEPPFALASVAFDDSGDGVAERRIDYAPDGSLRVAALPAAPGPMVTR
jgi:hypothetical protein